MKTPKKPVLTALAFSAIGGAFVWGNRPRPAVEPLVTPPVAVVAAGVKSPVDAVKPAPPAIATVPPLTSPPPAQGAGAVAATAQPRPAHFHPDKPPIQDPVARIALSAVGVDPEAEAYWVAAINNPDLPPEERKDLIEDLNEDGLSDPAHPGPQDMPVIQARLDLLDNLVPMDDVNLAAMQEARKDLVALLNGEEVK